MTSGSRGSNIVAIRTVAATVTPNLCALSLLLFLSLSATAAPRPASAADAAPRAAAVADATLHAIAGIPGGAPFDSSAPPLAVEMTSPVADVVPGRLVVKYRHSVDDCVHCILARGQSFAKTTGRGSLDRLNAELGVTAAHSLFFQRHDMSAAEARTAFALHVDAVRARRPQRTLRAPPGAPVPDLTHVYELELSPDVDVVSAATRYAADPDVVYAEPIRQIHVSYLPDDPYLSSSATWGQSYEDLWGMYAIDAPTAWDTASGAGAIIAVVDTGVDPAHADIAANRWSNPGEIPGNGVDDDANGYIDDYEGWDFHNDDNDPLDKHGHGTHVSAIAAGVGDDGYGVAGVAYDARIMALKGLSDAGSGFDSRLSEAMVYAADNGADVINNSWGGFGPARDVYEAISYADALGVVVVSASGNEGLEVDNLLWLPHGHPQGLTVGALQPDGTLAGFSNYGPFQSIAAPGVDVLAARSDKNTFGNSSVVDSDWLRLSGTSMASPHAAGAAATLLSAQPSLTTAEVRWHLELNAKQPPGFEGDLFNTTYGYGALDAGAMFAPVPVTTRLRAPNQTVWHSFAEQRTPPGRPASVSFTTLSPEPWSVSAFAPLAPVASSGAGDTPIDLLIDAASASPGDYQGDVVFSAPGAIDGGAAFPAEVHVHADARVGVPITVATESFATFVTWAPAIAGSHMASVAAWNEIEPDYGLHVALIDAAGNVTGPTYTGTNTAVSAVQVATDEHEFLVAWRDSYFSTEGVHFERVGADGGLLDTVPVRIVTRHESYSSCKFVTPVGAGFDGEDYWVAYNDRRLCGKGKSTLYLTRVHRDGSFARPKRVARIKSRIYPVFTCRGSDCMFAWWDTAIESTDQYGKYIRSAYAMPVSQGEALGDPVKILTDLYGLTAIASDGQDYMALGHRDHFCAVGDNCRTEVIGVRIDGDTGAPLDTSAISVSNASPLDRLYPWPGGITHDGSDYVASYHIGAVYDSPFDNGSYVFVNRIGSDGNPQSTEPIGTLVESSGRSSQSRPAATQLGTVVFYENGEYDELEEAYPHPGFTDHLAQRMYAREPDPDLFPEIEIGSIGTQALGERGYVRLRVVASGLDAQTTVYGASGLPAGAVFDPTTRMFQWSPDGAAAGSYPGVVFTATDGVGNVAESVQFDVSEAIPTATGLIRLSDGTPVGGIALDIKGTSDRRRTAYTKADGTFSIEELQPGRKFKMRIGKASKKAYTLTPKTTTFVVSAGDRVIPDILATPR